VVDKIEDRFTFACMWADGDDLSDEAMIGENRLRDVVLGKASPSTGIEKATLNTQPSTLNAQPYYDLSGRRVAQPANGVFIHNGKKVVIK
jgi:hypothetical protein